MATQPRPEQLDERINLYSFRLSPAERASGTWVKAREQLEMRLEDARKRLEIPQDQSKTDVLRGEIKCLRSVLAFGTDPPPDPDGGGEGGTLQGVRVRR